MHPCFRSLTPFALLVLAASLGCETAATGGCETAGAPGCGTTATESGADGGKCVHQAGAVPGLDWSLVCGTPAEEYPATVAALDDGVLFGFTFGNEQPSTVSLDLGGGAMTPFGDGDIVVGSFDKAGSHRWSHQWG